MDNYTIIYVQIYLLIKNIHKVIFTKTKTKLLILFELSCLNKLLTIATEDG